MRGERLLGIFWDPVGCVSLIVSLRQVHILLGLKLDGGCDGDVLVDDDGRSV